MMSYAWKRIGNFGSVEDAERWCHQSGIAHQDAQISPGGDGVVLQVRESAVGDKDDDPRLSRY